MSLVVEVVSGTVVVVVVDSVVVVVDSVAGGSPLVGGAGSLDGVARSLTMVSSSLGRAARLLPVFSRRQHELLALLSGEHAKHSSICAALVCSPTTLKREVRRLRERLGLASHHELPAYARSLGYSPYLSAGEIGLLPGNVKPIPEPLEALR